MAIKDLLVAYQGDESSRNALRFALQMASKYDAMVTGVHVLAARDYDTHQSWIPDNVREVMAQAQRDAAAQVENSFRDFMAQAESEAEHAWITTEGAPSLL